MDTSTASVIVAIVALISSVGGIFVANRYTARTARDAQARTAEIEAKKLDAASWQQQVDSWRADARELREQREKDTERFEIEQRRMQDRITELERVNVHTERELARVRIYSDAITTWGRIVVELLNGSSISYPPMPPKIGDTDPGRQQAVTQS